MIQSYLQEIEGTLSPATVKQYRERLERFETWLLGRKLDRKWNRASVVAFLKDLTEQAYGRASIREHKAAISAFYTWLVENEVIASNPVRSMALGRYRSNKKTDDCVFTPEEYEKVKAACRGRKLRFDFWEGATVVGWNTGLRLGDVASLEWGAVNFSEEKIDIIPNKTKRFQKRVEIPMTAELHQHLQKIYPERISGHVFPAMHRQYVESGAKHLSQQFTRICESAGVFDKSFHGLRHALASRLLTAGTPLNVISGITGHTIPVLDRYSHAAFGDKVKAMEALR